MTIRRRFWSSLPFLLAVCWSIGACSLLPFSPHTITSAAGPPPEPAARPAPANAVLAPPEPEAGERLGSPTEAAASPAPPEDPQQDAPLSPTAPPTPLPPEATEPPASGIPLFSEPPANQNPLTGLPVDNPEILDRKPLAIKITNFPRQARPQWGLSAADLVFEYYLEYGLTRFFAIFHGTDVPRVGPIRSARFFDEHLVRMYKSIFVFAHADDRVIDHLLETELADYFVIPHPDNCPPLCRDAWVDGYNNLFTSTQNVAAYIEDKGFPNERQELIGMYFSPESPEGGLPGAAAETVFSTSSYNRWTYDPDTGRYLRLQDAAGSEDSGEIYVPLKDRLTESQVAADNVVVLMVPHSYYSEVPEIVTMELLGYGTAYAFRDGRMYKVFWGRATETSVLVLVSPDGVPFTLKPGNTFFEVIGESSGVWQFGDTWRFEFSIP